MICSASATVIALSSTVDFDGTLAQTRFPEIIAPNKKMVAFVKTIQAAGHKVRFYCFRFTHCPFPRFPPCLKGSNHTLRSLRRFVWLPPPRLLLKQRKKNAWTQ